MIADLSLAADTIRAHLDRVVLRDERLLWSEFEVLHFLSGSYRSSVREIAVAVGVPPVRVVTIVDGLAARGLVRPVSDPLPQTVYGLSPAGRVFLRRIRDAVAVEEEHLLTDPCPAVGVRVAVLLRRLRSSSGHCPPRTVAHPASPWAYPPGIASQRKSERDGVPPSPGE